MCLKVTLQGVDGGTLTLSSRGCRSGGGGGRLSRRQQELAEKWTHDVYAKHELDPEAVVAFLRSVGCHG